MSGHKHAVNLLATHVALLLACLFVLFSARLLRCLPAYMPPCDCMSILPVPSAGYLKKESFLLKFMPTLYRA